MTCDPTTVPAPDEVDIHTLRNRYREERDRRLRPDGQEQYAAAFQETEAVDFSDPHMTRSSRHAVSDVVDVVVLGGGWAGVLAGYHLRKAGVTNFRIIEQAGDFGGVWYWNRYPGLSCDNDSYCYLPLLEEMQFFRLRNLPTGSRSVSTAKASQESSSLYKGALFHMVTHCGGLSR